MPSILRTALSACALGLLASSSVSAQNLDCTIQLPANPLSATGLSTPYILAGLNPPITTTTAGPCNQATFIQRTFVQGAIINPATGVVTLYDPLVIDAGTTPAVKPIVPVIAAGSVVALWFGNNANTLTLLDNNGALAMAKCVNGLVVNGKVDLFGEYSYCNAPAWFKAANAAIAAGKLVVPNLGTYNVPAGTNAPLAALPAGSNFVPTTIPAQTNVPCPTVRSFAVIDQDQSDNMVTSYLLTSTGATAQDTPANRAQLNFGAANGAQQIVNASDNRLISIALAGALVCKPMVALDLVSGNMLPSYPLNELFAAAKQQAPVALVPANDPMVLLLGTTTQSLGKVNLFRAGANQPPTNNLAKIAGTAYCLNYGKASPTRIIMDSPLTIKAGSPVPAVGNSLYTFMVGRINAAWTILTCDVLLGAPGVLPFNAVMDGNGVVLAANINPQFTTAIQKFIAAQATAKTAAKAAAQAAAAKAAAAKQAAAAAAGKAAAGGKTAGAAAGAAAAAAAAGAGRGPASAAAVAAGQAGIQAALAALGSGATPDVQAAIAALQAAQAAQAALAATVGATANSAELELFADETDEADEQQDGLIPDTVDDLTVDDSSNTPADDSTTFDFLALTAQADAVDTDVPEACATVTPSNNGFSGMWFGIGAASMMGLVAVVGSGVALAKRRFTGYSSSERENMQTIHTAQSDSV